MALVQIKGTKSSFKKKRGKLSGFPCNTVLYAELFHLPFFIFYTSLKDEMTRFVWVQKYIQCVLDESGSSWRKQDSVTIAFPQHNVLIPHDKKITSILHRHAANRDGMKFLSHYEWFRIYWGVVRRGTIAAINECLENFNGMRNCKLFFDIFYIPLPDSDLDGLRDALHEVRKTGKLSKINRELIDEQVEHLEHLKMWFLDQDESDVFSANVLSDETPY
jgi:hypothetical protein